MTKSEEWKKFVQVVERGSIDFQDIRDDFDSDYFPVYIKNYLMEGWFVCDRFGPIDGPYATEGDANITARRQAEETKTFDKWFE